MFARIGDCVGASIQRFKDNIKKGKERLITAANCISGNMSKDKKKKKKKKKATKPLKQKRRIKQCYGYFKR